MEETGKGVCSKLKVNFVAAKPMHSSGLDMIKQVEIPEGNSPKEVFFFFNPSFSLLPLLLLLETNQIFFLRDGSANPI